MFIEPLNRAKQFISNTKQSCKRYLWWAQHSRPHADLQERTFCELQAQQTAWCKFAGLFNKCLPEVSTELPLLPVTGESHPRGTTLEPGARLDILASGFHSPTERAFFDVRVSRSGAPTNSIYETPAEMYAAHEAKDDQIQPQSHSGRER